MNRKQTLEQLENSRWPMPDFDSHVTRRCHELRKVPLDSLQTEDLRLLISQEIGLEYIIPLAIEKLSTDILAEGDFYPGDLLKAVLSVTPVFWNTHKTEWNALDTLIRENASLLSGIRIDTNKFYGK